jgi:hypothetical protein
VESSSDGFEELDVANLPSVEDALLALQGASVEDMADGGSYWLAGTASAIRYVLNETQPYSAS